jgi:hypothetical protein
MSCGDPEPGPHDFDDDGTKDHDDCDGADDRDD